MLFSAPTLLKHRIILTLIYSAGLRGQEVVNLKISDIDFERMVIHIRQSKCKKIRIVPLSTTMAIGLKKYLSAGNPYVWLFNGKESDGRIRRFGIYHHSTKRHLDLQFVPDEKPDIDQLMAPQKDETTPERILRLTGFDVTRCPHCKKGRLIVIRTLPRIRSPAGHLPSMLLTKLL